jgi:hypothetical protein
MVRPLLNSDSPVERKIAIILLDNLADVLMYRRCVQEFEIDSSLAPIRKPRFTLSKRDEALRYFRTKANVLTNIKIISAEDSTVLKIGHEYRNAAYHRDIHNPRVTNKLGRLLFMSVCNLFASYYDNGVSVGAGQEEEWLVRYGVRTSFINLATAAKAITAMLKKDLSITLVEARTALREDVTLRVKDIERSIAKLPIHDAPAELDEALKMAEFSYNSPKERFMGEVNELNYIIGSGDWKAVTPKRYRIAETRAKKRMQKELAHFVPICSMRLFRKMKTNASLMRATTVPSLLAIYQALDSKLSCFERSVEHISIAFDQAIQHQIDLMRGK